MEAKIWGLASVRGLLVCKGFGLHRGDKYRIVSKSCHKIDLLNWPAGPVSALTIGLLRTRSW